MTINCCCTKKTYGVRSPGDYWIQDSVAYMLSLYRSNFRDGDTMKTAIQPTTEIVKIIWCVKSGTRTYFLFLILQYNLSRIFLTNYENWRGFIFLFRRGIANMFHLQDLKNRRKTFSRNKVNTFELQMKLKRNKKLFDCDLTKE